MIDEWHSKAENQGEPIKLIVADHSSSQRKPMKLIITDYGEIAQ